MVEAEMKVIKVIQAKVVLLDGMQSKVIFQTATPKDIKNQQELRLEVERLYKLFAEGAMRRREEWNRAHRAEW